MAESPFQPMIVEELEKVKRQNMRAIVEGITHIKKLVVNLRNVDLLESSSLGELVDDLEETYNSEKDDEHFKKHWEGISQTLNHLTTFNEYLIRKYATFIAELSRNNNIDQLIQELDMRLDDFTQGT